MKMIQVTYKVVNFLMRFCCAGICFLTMHIHDITIADESKIKNWLCYYGDTFGPDVYSRFDLVVLDGTNHPRLPAKGKDKPIILGYVSIGEVDVSGPLWKYAKDKPYLVKRNDFWDSWVVDIRNPSWQRLLFETAIPSVLEQGFDGLFLDTFDSSLGLLEGKDGAEFRGTEEALKEITMKIKAEYPEIPVAVNRGLPALPYFGKYIDFIVIEDLYSYYADHEQGYIKVDESTQMILLDQVRQGLLVNPEIVILTLDYVSSKQAEIAKNAISFSRKKGFIPYVSTYKLDQIHFYTLDD
ncbi:MAG: endo alpha-1,4 polygalactosaminidase [Candidatus Scalindua sp.]|nr:endo alpha-1,4 polygalactosaminidase [Candidatus Scalindua sp.]